MKTLIRSQSGDVVSRLKSACGLCLSKPGPARWVALGAATVAAAASVALLPRPSDNYVAHEWGTFTSLQRSDGELLEWHPLETSHLPGFVYDWGKPGYERRCTSPFGSSKAYVATKQRMETPVIYFYSAQPRTVDVEVRFPKGLITEWYPQATRIGPSSVRPPWPISTLDECAHKVGVKSGFTFASLLRTSAAADSRACWSRVHILGNQTNFAPALPQDTSGRHYFAARETDASLISVPRQTTNVSLEIEKFIFYRGVGNFESPLRVISEPEGWTVWNQEKEPLADLFFLTVENGRGRFQRIQRLAGGQNVNVPSASSSEAETMPLAKLVEELAKEMQAALERNGLYSREAESMIGTWKDSWFREEGTRVLYVLPRAWTDRVLPLTLNPRPAELTRVMVGRAEVLSWAVEQRLAAALRALEQEDADAQRELMDQLKALGRFAEPALRLVANGASNQTRQKASELLHLASAKLTAGEYPLSHLWWEAVAAWPDRGLQSAAMRITNKRCHNPVP